MRLESFGVWADVPWGESDINCEWELRSVASTLLGKFHCTPKEWFRRNEPQIKQLKFPDSGATVLRTDQYFRKWSRNNVRREAILTWRNFNATNLKPFCSKRLMILPTSPRWTPSGLTMMKVRSWLAAIAFDISENNANKVQIIYDQPTWNEWQANDLIESMRPVGVPKSEYVKWWRGSTLLGTNVKLDSR